MTTQKFNGIPYHVWNQATDMDDYMAYFGLGPQIITRGDGPYLYNQRGTRYINGLSSLWNVAGGLGQEKLVATACEQMRELAFSGCWQMVHPRAIELSAKLIAITGGHYQHVMLGSNGSDAVEASLKMARQYHKQSNHSSDHSRYKILSLRGSYHGFSYGCLSTSGVESDVDKFGPLLPGFIQIDPPYCYRCPWGKEGFPECQLLCAQELEQKILAEGAGTVAAFIIEPVMGDFGIVAGPEEYYTRVAEICKHHGVLLIADEVTTGFGRTGKLFATQDWQPQPDILCLGKAITNGYFPLSATLATETIYQRFSGKKGYFCHGVTHGGHPVGCAIALAAIDIIIHEKLPENASQAGRYLFSRFEVLKERHKAIGDIRAYGLMLCLELVKNRQNKKPLSISKTNEIVTDIALSGLVLSTHKNQIRLLPPLTIDESLSDEMINIIDRALETGAAAMLGKKVRMLNEYRSAKVQAKKSSA